MRSKLIVFCRDGSCPEIHNHFRRSIAHRSNMWGIPLNLPDLKATAVVKEMGPVLWNSFFSILSGRGREKDKISPALHVEVVKISAQK
jgi:hypothetical protein